MNKSKIGVFLVVYAAEAQRLMNASLPVALVDPQDYGAIFIAGALPNTLCWPILSLSPELQSFLWYSHQGTKILLYAL